MSKCARTGLQIGLFIVTSLAAVGLAHAIGEQTGRIKGTITDGATKAPMPGVTVTVRSPALIGGPRTVFSSDDGRYEVPNLPPGEYVVEVEYPGGKPAIRRIIVRQGETAPLDIVYSAEMEEETVRVVARQRLTRPDSNQTGTVLGADAMARVATGRTYQNIAQQVPGVSGGGNPNIKGGVLVQNRYLIDGLDITDPVTGTFSTNLTFDSIGSVEVITGGMEAQYNAMGGVINVITNGGSDDWQANASVFVGHSSLATSGTYGAFLYDGVRPFNDTAAGSDQSGQANVNIGGPLISQRLWFNATYEFRFTEIFAAKGPPLGVPPFDIQHPARTFYGHFGRLKLNWAPSAAHHFSLSANADPAFINNTAAGNKNFYLGVAEGRQNQGGMFSIASWDYFINNNVNTNVQAGFQVFTIETGPQGRLATVDFTGCDKFSAANCTYDPNRARRVNNFDGTAWYQGGVYQLDRRWTGQFDPSVSIRGSAAGSHDAKIGIQARVNYRTRTLETPGGSVFTDGPRGAVAGAPLEAGLCDPTAPGAPGCFRRTDRENYKAHQTGYGAGLYLQDRWWTSLKWLTLLPGVRFDYGRTLDRKGNEVSSLFGIGPRFGAIVDLTGDSKTILSGFYGRANEVLTLLPASNVDNSEQAVERTFEWDPMTNDYTIPIAQVGGPGNSRVAKNLKPPRTDEITASLRREILQGSAAGVDYTWKRVSNMWDGVEVNRIWDPTGTRVVGFVDPNKPLQAVIEYATLAANYRTYQGVDVYVEGRPTQNWDFAGAYTLSWTYGPGTSVLGQNNPRSQFDNPRQAKFYDGFLPEDLRHQIKARASYSFRGLTVGAFYSYLSGAPLTKTFFNATTASYINYRSPLGTEPGAGNDITQVSEFRLPDRSVLDMRVSYNILPQMFRSRLILIADIFNVFNSRLPTDIVSADLASGTFGQVAARQAPFRAQLAINYRY